MTKIQNSNSFSKWCRGGTLEDKLIALVAAGFGAPSDALLRTVEQRLDACEARRDAKAAKAVPAVAKPVAVAAAKPATAKPAAQPAAPKPDETALQKFARLSDSNPPLATDFYQKNAKTIRLEYFHSK